MWSDRHKERGSRCPAAPRRDQIVEILAWLSTEAGQAAQVPGTTSLQQKIELGKPLGCGEESAVILKGADVAVIVQGLDKVWSGSAGNGAGAHLTDLKQGLSCGDPRVSVAAETNADGGQGAAAVDEHRHHRIDRHVGGEHEQMCFDAKAAVVRGKIRGNAGRSGNADLWRRQPVQPGDEEGVALDQFAEPGQNGRVKIDARRQSVRCGGQK